MELTNGKDKMDVDTIKQAILRQKTTKNRFKVKQKKDEVFKLLGTAVFAEVKARKMPFERNATIESQLTMVTDWITEDEKNPWLVICGNCGNGKTTMMKAFANMVEKIDLSEMIDGRFIRMRVKVTNAKELAAECVRGYDEFKSFISVPILAVDDVGTEPLSLKDYGTILTPVSDMIDYRYERALLTILTTNLTPPDISARYGERTADRLREMAEFIAFTNESYREQFYNANREKEDKKC